MLENDDFDNFKPDMPQDDDITLGEDLDTSIDANIDDTSSQDNGLNFNDVVENLGEVNNVEGNADFVDSFTPNDINEGNDMFGMDDTPLVGEAYGEPKKNDTVTVQPVKFASFDDAPNASGEASKNLDNLLDIKLQLTVELGRATLPVKKVLELTRGSIIELEKIAGEPVELYANGKLIAHGEVVVIEDNFGLRITSMTEPENRLNGLQ